MHTPLKETSPCLIGFCTKHHHMSTRHFFVALLKQCISPAKKLLLVSQTFGQSAIICQRNISLTRCQNNTYTPQRNLEALNLTLLVLSGHVCNHHTPRMLLFHYQQNLWALNFTLLVLISGHVCYHHSSGYYFSTISRIFGFSFVCYWY